MITTKQSTLYKPRRIVYVGKKIVGAIWKMPIGDINPGGNIRYCWEVEDDDVDSDGWSRFQRKQDAISYIVKRYEKVAEND